MSMVRFIKCGCVRMNMVTIKQAKVAVYHQDCYASITTERFPGITLAQVSPVVILSKKGKKTDYKILWEVEGNSPSELSEYLKFLKEFRSTKELLVLDSQPLKALILHQTISPNSSYDAVLKSNMVYLSPITVEDGMEVHSVISHDPKGIGKMLSELDEIGESKVLRIGDFDPKKKSRGLTKKQLDSLLVALDNGYYKWPKKATLEDLAKIEGISRRSVQERIRRGEAKLMPKAIGNALKIDG